MAEILGAIVGGIGAIGNLVLGGVNTGLETWQNQQQIDIMKNQLELQREALKQQADLARFAANTQFQVNQQVAELQAKNAAEAFPRQIDALVRSGLRYDQAVDMARGATYSLGGVTYDTSVAIQQQLPHVSLNRSRLTRRPQYQQTVANYSGWNNNQQITRSPGVISLGRFGESNA
uniref:VP2 n=1 Tax=Bamboo rat calicvirus TaxID=3038166 RepID=A0AAT9TWT4_9CALI|nr:VP2 [Bamboo rat calicvirus]